MDTHTDDELIRIYETALGPLQDPSTEWLADALVWIRRIVQAQTVEQAALVVAMWTAEPAPEARQLAESLRTAAGKAPPVAEPEAPADPWMVHASEVEGVEQSHGSRSGSRYHPLSAALGDSPLDCCLYVVDPGKRAFHFVSGDGVEEAIFIVEGEGMLHLSGDAHPVCGGTYCRISSDSEDAHQLHNTGTTPLRYLCIAAGSSVSSEA